jgi:polar amino acid transport system substrate-binding protein
MKQRRLMLVPFIAIGLVLVSLLMGCVQVAEQPAAEQPAAEEEPMAEGAIPQLDRSITIGVDAAYPPFESVDEETGEVVGFDPSLMARMADLIGLEYEFQPTAWDGIFAALASGEFDAVMSAVTITEERDEIVDFTMPYYQVGQVVSVQQGEEEIQSYEDLASGAIVAVQTGTTGDFAATDIANVPEDNMRRFATIDLAYQALVNGDVDAVVADSPTSNNYVSRFEGDLRIVGGEGAEAWFTTEDYGIAVQEGDDELINALDAAISQLREEGVIQDLLKEWEVE